MTGLAICPIRNSWFKDVSFYIRTAFGTAAGKSALGRAVEANCGNQGKI